jgi:hypothetical protein
MSSSSDLEPLPRVSVKSSPRDGTHAGRMLAEPDLGGAALMTKTRKNAAHQIEAAGRGCGGVWVWGTTLSCQCLFSPSSANRARQSLASRDHLPPRP